MPTRAVGLRILVVYKILHGAVVLALGIALAIATFREGSERLHELAVMLREHVMRAWTIQLADLLVRSSSPRLLQRGGVALVVDGLFTLFEGWALKRQFRWASWLVVVATAALLPFEIFELYRRVRAGRTLVLVLNLAVLVYLVRRTWRERQVRDVAPRAESAQ